MLLDTDKFRPVFEWAIRDRRLQRISLLRLLLAFGVFLMWLAWPFYSLPAAI
jgi:hypothetical protein